MNKLYVYSMDEAQNDSCFSNEKKTRENPSLENIREHSKYANNNRNYFGPKKNSSKASYKI